MKQMSLAATGFEITTKRTREPGSHQLAEQFEKIKAGIRANVEHPFRVIKCKYGFVKVPYRGLARNTAQLVTPFARKASHAPSPLGAGATLRLRTEHRPKLSNACSETIAKKMFFRETFKRRRCLVTANGDES